MASQPALQVVYKPAALPAVSPVTQLLHSQFFHVGFVRSTNAAFHFHFLPLFATASTTISCRRGNSVQLELLPQTSAASLSNFRYPVVPAPLDSLSLHTSLIPATGSLRCFFFPLLPPSSTSALLAFERYLVHAFRASFAVIFWVNSLRFRTCPTIDRPTSRVHLHPSFLSI